MKLATHASAVILLASMLPTSAQTTGQDNKITVLRMGDAPRHGYFYWEQQGAVRWVWWVDPRDPSKVLIAFLKTRPPQMTSITHLDWRRYYRPRDASYVVVSETSHVAELHNAPEGTCFVEIAAGSRQATLYKGSFSSFPQRVEAKLPDRVSTVQFHRLEGKLAIALFHAKDDTPKRFMSLYDADGRLLLEAELPR